MNAVSSKLEKVLKQLVRICEFPIERKRLAVAAGEMRVYMGELLVKHCTATETKQDDRR